MARDRDAKFVSVAESGATRVTLKGKNRLDAAMPTCTDADEAKARSAIMSEQVRRLRKAGKVATKSAETLFEEFAAAVDPTDAVTVIGELCGVKGDRSPTPKRRPRARPRRFRKSRRSGRTGTCIGIPPIT